jgi:hypothetical protein
MQIHCQNEKKFKINTLSDLVVLGELEVLTPKQYADVISQVKPFVGIFLKEYTSTKDMAAIIKNNLDRNEKHIFLDWTP